jgi:hypothetical protein
LRRAGATCPRWLVLAICLLALAGRSAVVAQEKLQRPGSDDNSKFESYRQGHAPVIIENNKADTEQNRQVLDRFARYLTLRLNASTTKNEDYRNLHEEAGRRMALTAKRSELNPQQKQFIAEFGKAMITHLEGMALNSAKPQVRVNAAWMAADVGKMGYDGAAELYIKILEKDDMNDAVKLWALRGLDNLFKIVPDPIIPEKTVFQQANKVELPELERRAIQALIKYIEQKVNVAALSPDEINALRYIRREAVRALGHVRVQTVKHLGKVESRPAFVLLKVACNDDSIPPLWPDGWDRIHQPPTEQLDAIVGFCQLRPDINARDLNLDYAVFHIGQAIQAVAEYRIGHLSDTSVSWKAAGFWLRDSLETWRNTSNVLKIQDAKLISDLIDKCDVNIIQPLENGIANNPPDVLALRQWLGATQPKSDSLFKNDPATKIKKGQ